MARVEFSDRHIGPSGDEISTMLLELGYSDLESFTQAVLPDSIKLTSKFGPLLQLHQRNHLETRKYLGIE